MTIKVWNVSDWEPVTSETVLVLPAQPGRGDESRRIKIDINAAWPTVVWLMREGHDFFHLGTVSNVETIEFSVPGEARICFSSALVGTDEVKAWIYTADGQKQSFDVPDAGTFTRPAGPRARNPELERMMWIMNENMERRLDQQRREMARMYRADQDTGEVTDEPNPRRRKKDKSDVQPDIRQPDAPEAPSSTEPDDGSQAPDAPKTSGAKPVDAGTA